MKTAAIILAGGGGERFNATVPKQFVKLAGKLIIEHTINVFERHPLINEIYLVVHSEFYNLLKDIVQHRPYSKVEKVLVGGATRQESSKIGVSACEEDIEKVLIHDAVRPFVSESIITNVIQALDNFPYVDVAIPTADTIIEISDQNLIRGVPPRKHLLRGQTPQGFRLSAIKKAHILAEKEGYNSAPDDCSLILRYGLGDTYVVNGSEYNLKITYPLDLDIADKIFQIYKIGLPGIDRVTLEGRLGGKTVAIFGGTSGIGLEISKLCRELGAHSYEFSRKNGVDIRDFKSIKGALEKVFRLHNGIDSVVCSAGILEKGFIERIEISTIIDQVSINLVGNMLVAKASIPYLKQTKGSLIFFASSSYTRGRSEYASYSASKAGLVNFVQGFADEVSQYGIRVNVINPERTDTPLRHRNFGNENRTTLLSPRFVALATLRTVVSDITGAVVNVRKMDESRELTA